MISILKLVKKGGMEIEGDDNYQLSQLGQIPGHKLDVNCVTFNPVFTNIMASASDDRMIKLWEVNE